jgi:protein disulfide-isomerase A6
LTFGFPAVVAISFEQDAYQVMKGPFSEGAITTFAQRNENWRKRKLIDLSEMPTIVTTEPWDGQDGRPIEEENEIPLSDIMGDEL